MPQWLPSCPYIVVRAAVPSCHYYLALVTSFLRAYLNKKKYFGLNSGLGKVLLSFPSGISQKRSWSLDLWSVGSNRLTRPLNGTLNITGEM